MRTNDLFERIAQLPDCPPNMPVVPPAELVAFVIRVGRGLRSWKRSTLAEFASVSLSTVERAERGESVSSENLDRIAEALGYGAGYFTAPRCCIPRDEAAAQIKEDYGELVPVRVAPLLTQSQVRAAIRSHAILPYKPELPEDWDGDVANLVEWLDLAAFMTSDFTTHECRHERRKLYNDILDCVVDMERRGVNVLFGVMDAPQPGIPDWKVAVISISLKSKDPGARKRKYLFVDRRIVALPERESSPPS